MIHIDGSLLEGGGQIIRNALSLSVLTKTPITITNIRAKRQKPGLMEQHLKGLQLIQQLCNAEVSGDKIGSTQLQFTPGPLTGGYFKSVVKTAGSIALVLQASLPCALFADSPCVFQLQGGTNAEMAPQIDYITEIFKPNLNKFGATFEFSLVKRGYFPKGGGEVEITINCVDHLNPINLSDFGQIRNIHGWSYVSGKLPISVAHELACKAKTELQHCYRNIEIDSYKETREIAPVGDCAGIILVAETSTDCILGGSSLQRKQETVCETAQRASNELLKCIEKKCCLDEHCQDQVIIFMALANGRSKIKVSEVTMHTKTAIYVAELLTKVRFCIEEQSDGCFLIECDGIGLKR